METTPPSISPCSKADLRAAPASTGSFRPALCPVGAPGFTHLFFSSTALLGLCHQIHRPVLGMMTLPGVRLGSPDLVTPSSSQPRTYRACSSHPCTQVDGFPRHASCLQL